MRSSTPSAKPSDEVGQWPSLPRAITVDLCTNRHLPSIKAWTERVIINMSDDNIFFAPPSPLAVSDKMEPIWE